MPLPGRIARSPGSDMGANRSNGASKERLKWTKELHDLFEKAVNQIGGPDRATPRGILRAMAIPGLTIFHVKSHLQKYRMSIFTREDDYKKSKNETRSISDMLPNFSVTSAAQLNEALKIQMEAQRRLSDQLEVQKSLKMKIEAQGRFLDKIMEEYKNRAPSTKPVKPYSPILSLPSLSEESDHSNGLELESDSEEVGSNCQMRSKDEFQARKRIKVQDNVLQQQVPKIPSLLPESQNLNVFSIDGINNPSNLFSDQETGFSWSLGAFQSPLLPAMYNPLS